MRRDERQPPGPAATSAAEHDGARPRRPAGRRPRPSPRRRAPTGTPSRSRLRAQRAQGRRRRLHERAAGGAARERLDAERAAAGEDVEDDVAGERAGELARRARRRRTPAAPAPRPPRRASGSAPSTSNTASRTLSEVGRVARPAGALSGRPRQAPPTTLTQAAFIQPAARLALLLVPAEDERLRRRRLLADGERRLQHEARLAPPRGVAREHGRERLAGLDGVADRALEQDARRPRRRCRPRCGGRPRRAAPPARRRGRRRRSRSPAARRLAPRARPAGGTRPAASGRPARSTSARSARRRARRRAPPPPARAPRRASTPRSASGSSSAASSSVTSRTSRGPSPLQHLPGLLDLEPVADGAPERRVHGGEEAGGRALVGGPDQAAETADLPGVVQIGRERPASHLEVEDDRRGAAGHLLGHDARRDQPVALDGAGHVAQRVQQPVGGHDALALADDGDADALELAQEVALRQLHAEAGDGLELVQRAAGVPEARARTSCRRSRRRRRPAAPARA